MKNRAIKIVGTIVIVGGMVFFASGVGAQGISDNSGNVKMVRVLGGEGNHRGQGILRHLDADNAAAVRSALAAKDYEAWKLAVAEQESNLPEGAKSLLERIDTEEEFLKFADKLSEKETSRLEREADREQIKAAIEANDYETWKSLVAARESAMSGLNFSMLDKIDSADKFAQLKKINDLQNEIRKIKESLGLLISKE